MIFLWRCIFEFFVPVVLECLGGVHVVDGVSLGALVYRYKAYFLDYGFKSN